jgi:hypothetical protein
VSTTLRPPSGKTTFRPKTAGGSTWSPRRVAASVAYLQPGSKTVWPGGWHLAPPSFGPFWLLPGPKSGFATAGAAGMASAPTDRMAAKSLRLRMILLLRGPSQFESGLDSLVRPAIESEPTRPGHPHAAVTPKGWGLDHPMRLPIFRYLTRGLPSPLGISRHGGFATRSMQVGAPPGMQATLPEGTPSRIPKATPQSGLSTGPGPVLSTGAARAHRSGVHVPRPPQGREATGAADRAYLEATRRSEGARIGRERSKRRPLGQEEARGLSWNLAQRSQKHSTRAGSSVGQSSGLIIGERGGSKTRPFRLRQAVTRPAGALPAPSRNRADYARSDPIWAGKRAPCLFAYAAG